MKKVAFYYIPKEIGHRQEVKLIKPEHGSFLSMEPKILKFNVQKIEDKSVSFL